VGVIGECGGWYLHASVLERAGARRERGRRPRGDCDECPPAAGYKLDLVEACATVYVQCVTPLSVIFIHRRGDVTDPARTPAPPQGCLAIHQHQERAFLPWVIIERGAPRDNEALPHCACACISITAHYSWPRFSSFQRSPVPSLVWQLWKYIYT